MSWNWSNQEVVKLLGKVIFNHLRPLHGWGDLIKKTRDREIIFSINILWIPNLHIHSATLSVQKSHWKSLWGLALKITILNCRYSFISIHLPPTLSFQVVIVKCFRKNPPTVFLPKEVVLELAKASLTYPGKQPHLTARPTASGQLTDRVIILQVVVSWKADFGEVL